jgi:hypothetical protein
VAWNTRRTLSAGADAGALHPSGPSVPARPTSRPGSDLRDPCAGPAIRHRRGHVVVGCCERDPLAVTLVDELCTRTEGWAAGLVLAGLSLRSAPDPARFVEAFRGDDQLVVSYLSDELLSTMDADDRERLLETSMLDRLSGPLVDAVTASSGGRQWLIATREPEPARRPLGQHRRVVPLSPSPARSARARGAASVPERLPELHRRAATWFESQHDHLRAVEHRLAAGDIGAAMGLMRVVGPDLLGSGQIRSLHALLDRIGVAASDRHASVRCCGAGTGISPVGTSRHNGGSTPLSPSRPPRSTR